MAYVNPTMTSDPAVELSEKMLKMMGMEKGPYILQVADLKLMKWLLKLLDSIICRQSKKV